MQTFDDIEDRLEIYMDMVLPKAQMYLRNHSSKYQALLTKQEEMEKDKNLNSLLYKREEVFLLKEDHERFLDYVDMETSIRFMEYAMVYLLGLLDCETLEEIRAEVKKYF